MKQTLILGVTALLTVQGVQAAQLYWRHSQSGQNYVHQLHNETTAASKPSSQVGTEWQVQGIGDFNKDGMDDVVWRHQTTGAVYIHLLKQGILSETKYVNTVASSDWTIAGVADFNADGYADILWRNQVTGLNYLYLMNGTQISQQKAINTVPAGDWSIVGVGDTDGDDKADIIWHNQSSGLVYRYQMDGIAITASAAVASVADTQWQVKGVADMDGDGKADLIWRHQQTGQNYVYLMNGSSIASSGAVAAVSTTWQLADVADLNEDGRADWVWHNTSSGQNYAYYMNGLTRVKVFYLGTTVTDANWQMQGVLQTRKACDGVVASSDTGFFETSQGYCYMSKLRLEAGMSELQSNTQLQTAAANHAHYLVINNTSGHGELEGANGFTGSSPSARAQAAGYLSSATEGLTFSQSTQQKDEYQSEKIDQLMSAIYHRFSILDFDRDEVGMAIETGAFSNQFNTAYVHNNGNTLINTLCGGESFNQPGSFYTGVCADSTFRIEVSQYDSAVNTIRSANSSVVTWPAQWSDDVPPVFFEESPDPLPDYSVSGYPISIQFNPASVSTVSNVSMRLFEVVSGDEMTDVRFMTQANDPNGNFSALQYALFPLQRLNWNTSYRVEASYVQDGQSKQTQWTFATQSLPYPYYVTSSLANEVNVKSGQTYSVYFAPQNGTDRLQGYSGSLSGGGVDLQASFLDQNTLNVTITGTEGGWVNLNFVNGYQIKFNIAASDSAKLP